jgi:hypothetical protein
VSINSAIQGLVARGLRSVDHLVVLLALRDSTVPLTMEDLVASTNLRPADVAGCLRDLVAGRIAEHDIKASSYTYAASAEDRVAVDALALLHTQWPETLTKLFDSDPPPPIKSFSSAFRLRIDREDQ